MSYSLLIIAGIGFALLMLAIVAVAIIAVLAGRSQSS